LIRAPAVAGRFYPGEPEVLETLVARLLVSSGVRDPRPAIAVLSPHAGYAYSGEVAATVYASVRVPDRIILLGPNHTGLGPPLSLWDRGAWEMPGGPVQVDAEMGRFLMESCPELIPDRSAHRAEHCLEVQLPFLAARADGLRVSPVVVGTSRPEILHGLGRSVCEVVRRLEGKVLVVISSELILRLGNLPG
jgi:AmmeMemoRadiSam system protein B